MVLLSVPRTISLMFAVPVGLHLEKSIAEKRKDHALMTCIIWEAVKLTVANSCHGISRMNFEKAGQSPGD